MGAMSESVEYPRNDYRQPSRKPAPRRRPSLRRHLATISALSAILTVLIFSGLAFQMLLGNDPALASKTSSSGGSNGGGGISIPSPAKLLGFGGEGDDGIRVLPVTPSSQPAPAPAPAPTPLVTSPS